MAKKETPKPMDARRAQLVGMDCRDRLLNLVASMRTEWPGLPVEEIITAIDYLRAHVVLSHINSEMSAMNDKLEKRIKELEEGLDDDDDDEDEDNKSDGDPPSTP